MIFVLELLTDHEVELASAISVMIVKSVSPVNSKETDHRQEDSDTGAGRSSDLERIEISDIRPTVTSLKEQQCIDSRLRLKYHRIAKLDCELIIYITGIIVTCSTIC